MLFCPKCSSILRPKEKGGAKFLWCSCGFTTVFEKAKPEEPAEQEKEVKEEKAPEPETRRIEIVKEVEIHPKIKEVCEKCGNKEVYYWTQQTRGADEPETRFFKCTKCEHTWREYS